MCCRVLLMSTETSTTIEDTTDTAWAVTWITGSGPGLVRYGKDQHGHLVAVHTTESGTLPVHNLAAVIAHRKD